MLLENNDLIEFEGYTIDRPAWTLKWEQTPIALNRKSFDLLIYLIDHRNRVASKDELLAAIWPDQFVEESNLTQQIFLLRKALSRHGSGRKIVETVAGRGYQFTAPVKIDHRHEPREHVEHQIVLNTRESVTQITIEEEETESDEAGPADLTLPVGRANRMVRALATAAEWLRRLGSPMVDTFAVRLSLAVAVLGIFLAAYLVFRWSNPTHPSISTYTQVTHDGRAKYLGGTDGSRIYFTQMESSGIAEVSVSGGAVAPVQLGIQEPWSADISPDGSTLLVISQAVGQGPATALWSFHLVGGSLRRLANGVVSAGWSPDGDQIVYASANGELFVMRHDGSESHRIASPGGYLKSMAWSPAGDAIRFSRDGLLWEISPTGSNMHPLLPGWGKSPTQWGGQWAQDGRFVFAADGQIWMLEKRSKFLPNHPASPIQLTSGPTTWDRPLFSPDGKKIFASGVTERGELVRFDTKANQFARFLAGISAEFVVFSNDGKSVAYVSYPEGILYRANPDGSHPIQLTEPPVYPKSVRWSPDGSQIAFVHRGANGVDAVFVIASDGSGKPQSILPADQQAETDPSWSPDGRKIAFSTATSVGATAKSDLRIFDFATHKAAVIPGSDGLMVPHWSPDGSSIAGMTLDTVSLRLLDLASAKWTKLDTGAVAFPEWSHDSRWIYYVRWTADPAVLRIRVADGKQESVADLKGARYTGTYTLWMGLDPADAPMMLRDEGTDDIYALTLGRK
jgi:Tol biopolymer transport system component/DNA-binding winged helix-turn-helix (wHTH) protein